MALRPLQSRLSLLAFLLASFAGSAAHSREKPDPTGPDPLALEEIVVTATRREESIQEVPMSVTAFTSEFFREAGVSNLAGLSSTRPA